VWREKTERDIVDRLICEIKESARVLLSSCQTNGPRKDILMQKGWSLTWRSKRIDKCKMLIPCSRCDYALRWTESGGVDGHASWTNFHDDGDDGDVEK
jgi:hypothetical protein